MKGDNTMDQIKVILTDFLDKFVALLIEHLSGVFGADVSEELNNIFDIELL